MLSKLKIRTRLVLIFIQLIVFGAIFAFFWHSTFNSIQRDVNKVTKGSLVQLNSANSIIVKLQQTQIQLGQAVLSLDSQIHEAGGHEEAHDVESKINSIQKNILTQINDFDTQIISIRKLSESQVELVSGEVHEYQQQNDRIASLIEIGRETRHHKAHLNTILDLLVERKIEEAIAYLEQTAEPHFTHIQNLVQDYYDNEINIATEEGEEVVENIISLSVFTGGFFFIALTTLTLSNLAIAKSIINPLDSLTQTANKISKGKLSSRASVVGNSELTQLARGFNQMTDSLVSQTKLAKQSEDRLLASIRGLPIGFLLISKGKIILKNPAVSKIFGFKNKDWTAKDLNSKLLATKNTAKLNLIQTHKSTKEIKQYNFNHKFLRIISVPVVNNQKSPNTDTVFLFEDITEAKLLDQTRDEFFALASHELRTPLTSIRGNSSLLLDQASKLKQSQDTKEMITDIHESSLRLIDIVNDFLDASQLEQNKIEYKTENFSAAELTEGTVAELQELASAKNLKLEVHLPKQKALKVKADKNKTKQILINLVGNAIKFTAKGSITVSVAADNKHVKFTVKDTGGGISHEKQKMLFRKFTQTGSNPLTRDTTRSSGLGLYISQLLAKGMSGQIELEKSVPQKGSTFTLTLPKAK